MGSLPSSRLTKILQEKAELLKRKRQAGEAAVKEVEDYLDKLGALEIELPEAPARRTQLHELIRKSDWDAVELQAKALSEYIQSATGSAIGARRSKLMERSERLRDVGVVLPPELGPLLEVLGQEQATQDWSKALDEVALADKLLRDAQKAHLDAARSSFASLAEWAGVSEDRRKALDQQVLAALEPARRGNMAEALVQLNDLLGKELPEVVDRRKSARSTGDALIAAARDLGVPIGSLDSALRADQNASPLAWRESVGAVEAATVQVADGLRERVASAIESLHKTLESLRDYGVDPTSAISQLEEAKSRISGAAPIEIPKILADARAATEEPVVGVVAGQLDEVRPRIVEARRLGRDPSDVFAAMNRAREALRLKIYTEALAASQEAIDRVAQLTEDMDVAREEADVLEAMLQKLARARFPVEPTQAGLSRARALIRSMDVDGARSTLRELVRAVGREAVALFSERLDQLGKVEETARERGFLPPEAEGELKEARRRLDTGNLGETAELLSALEVRLRIAAGPYVARHVEEMVTGFREIPDESLIAPVRRLLADADVALRVKEDLVTSLDSLRRAERDFAAVFAAHASALVEGLEDERRSLESMGGTGDEIQRQIDEVQQIFNMGDFVKASRASQEIRNRARQQQLVRSEDAISHAKLALVELETMGLDLGTLRKDLDQAQEAARSQKYADSFRRASQVQDSATRTRAAAEETIAALATVQEEWTALKSGGVDVSGYRDTIKGAKDAYQQLDFPTSRAEIEKVAVALRRDRAIWETDRLNAESALLIEDGRRLAIPVESYVGRLDEVRRRRAGGEVEGTVEESRRLHSELVTTLHPVLEENLRSVERDLDVARAAGVETSEAVKSLGEARRRLGLPVPTGVAELIETSRSRLMETRGFVEHAARVAKRATEALIQADLLHVNVGEFRTRMEKVEQLLGDRQSARAIELSTTLEREIIQATYHQVSKTLAGFQGVIARVRRLGADTTIAENLLQQARAALEESRPVEALQLAARSEGEIERVELQRQIAEGALEATDRALGRADREFIRAEAARKEFDAARSAFDQHEYPRVLELALAASDSIESARHGFRVARDSIAKADRSLTEALELGVEAAEGLARLDVARRLSESGEYVEATRRAREAGDMGRSAVELLFASRIGELRRLIESVSDAPVESVELLRAALEESDRENQARNWPAAAKALNRARDQVSKAFDSVLDERLKEVDDLWHREAPASPAEAERRSSFRARVSEARSKRDSAHALEVIREEANATRVRWRSELDRRANALKEHLWVGEKLGLDTTRAMQLFSEARMAIDAGKLEAVASVLDRGEEAVRDLVGTKLEEKLTAVRSELSFAQDGLHVSLGGIPEAMGTVEKYRAEGRLVDGAKILLDAEEDLNRRKAYHRELLNLHYLIDAALAKASERHLDATPARRLLEESIQLREVDYVQALERAREAHRMLQELLRPPEAPAPAPAAASFWPFRRPPPS